MKIDCLKIIEAAYAPAASEAAWLASILVAFEPLARGLGVMAGIVEFGEAAPRVGDWVAHGPVPEALPADFTGMYSRLAQGYPGVLRALLSPNPSVVCWATERASSCIPEALRRSAPGPLARAGCLDALGILSAEPTGPSLLVNVPYSEEVAVPARTLHQLTRATAHLCSAMRLRRRALAGGVTGSPDGMARDVEAVLDPSGRLLHAQGRAEGRAARTSLTEAVRRVERARGRLRHTDPEEALSTWSALFDGRWSVIERCESDGRRLMLARRNRPGERDPRALTQGERDVLTCVARGHSNKYIAYLLGLATSTVSSRLESALRKLSVSSRREAIAMLGGGAAPA